MKEKEFITIGFFVSGAIGLTYEVLWQRELTLIFGTTLAAVTIVIAAFMGGLAIGSYLFGKRADNSPNPLKLYALLELGIGLYCFFMPFILRGITQLHQGLFHHFGQSILIDAFRLLLALTALIIPCALMGGTLPVISRSFIKRYSEVGSGISFLYFLNTMGAVTGTIITGFVFIRTIGLHATNYLAASMNLLIGVTFYFLARGSEENTKTSVSSSSQVQTDTGKRSYLPFLYCFLGAIALGCEVAWSRSLNLVIGSTVYAFTILLATYLLGIAIGSLLARNRIDNVKNPVFLVGIFSLLTGICIGLSVSVTSRLPVLFMLLFPKFHNNFYLWQGCLFMLGALVVFPATLFMGMTFPAIGKAYISRMKELSRGIGHLYLWNTLGGIIGSVITGFILIPTIGSRRSLIVFMLSFLFVGLAILFKLNPSGRFRVEIAILGLLCLLLAVILPHWDPALFDSGVYVYAPQLVNGFEANRKILYAREGLHAYVTVSEKAGVRSLRINGKTDGSDGGDLDTQVLLAHLPILHANKPKKVLIIGLGTGVTLGSAVTVPGIKADCIEIDESVIEASHYFDNVSGNPLSSSRARVINADARTVLETTLSHYDVIISEPSNPWITGVSNLFTFEHFKACKNALNPKGIMCQWIHSYYMDTDTLFLIFRTFGAVFPYCNLWRGSRGDFLILGSERPLEIQPEHIRNYIGIPDIAKDLNRIRIQTETDIMKRLILTMKEFQALINSDGGTINTDNHPIVEFNAPRSLYQDTVQANLRAILAFQTKAR